MNAGNLSLCYNRMLNDEAFHVNLNLANERWYTLAKFIGIHFRH